MKCKLSGPLYLSQGRDCLPGPSGFCRQPHLDHRWRKITVWDLEAVSSSPTYPGGRLATQSGGHSTRSRGLQPSSADKLCKVLCPSFARCLGWREVRWGRTRQAEGLGSGETSVWKLPGRQEPWWAAASFFYLDMPLKDLTCCLRTSKSPGWPGHC